MSEIKYYVVLIALLFTSSLLFAQEPDAVSSSEKGSKIYRKNCAVCHSKKGTGKGKRIPPLAQSDYLLNNISESIRAIRYGLSGEIKVNGVSYDKVMAPIELSNKEIADVMNFILNSWGNEFDEEITSEKVALAYEN